LKKIISIFLIGILVLGGSLSVAVTDDGMEYKCVIKNKNQTLQIQAQSTFFNDSELIDEYTWAVMQYDFNYESENFGLIKMPTPDAGTILSLTDMMSIDACRVAVSVYHEEKMDTLEALETYDINNMMIPFYAEHPILTILAANLNFIPIIGIQKFSANEMVLSGDISFKANLVGDCYSQAVLNTAILRLCGFSAEEVFTVLIPMHAVTIVQVDGQWYVFDSVAAQDSGHAIYDSLPIPPAMQSIRAIENDKYFINFGRGHPNGMPYLENLFSNIDPDLLIELIEHIVPIFNNATLGSRELEINEFLKNATACPEIATIEMPYNVEDATGSTVEEKAQSLADLNKEFIKNQTGREIQSQYDRSLYSLGLPSVGYPQAYANAAKYGSWTSWFAMLFDSKTSCKDIQRTVNWINFFIKTEQISNENYIYFSDFSCKIRKGSTLDKAIVAYGTLRNMKKDDDFWQPKDIYVLVAEGNAGYLATNSSKGWEYLYFGSENGIRNEPPENIKIFFNEIECLSVWGE